MTLQTIRILGIDPLRNTGWDRRRSGRRLSFVASGCVRSDGDAPMGQRCASCIWADGDHRSPCAARAAVEETFVNRDPQSALKLDSARRRADGAALAGSTSRNTPPIS